MACPLRIAVVTVSALIAFLALYLTFWQSEPDELDKAARDAQNSDADSGEEEGEGDDGDDVDGTYRKAAKVKPLLERIKSLSPREILLEGVLFHKRFSAVSLLWIGAVHVVVLSAVYFTFGGDASDASNATSFGKDVLATAASGLDVTTGGD